MKRTCLRAAACVGLFLVTSQSVAQSVSPELIELFVQLGIALDENGEPIAAPALPAPTVQAPPTAPLEFLESLGIAEAPEYSGAETSLLASQPPAQESSPEIDLRTEIGQQEFAELLNLPVEVLFPPAKSIPPVAPSPPPVEEAAPTSLSDVAALLGLTLEQLLGEEQPGQAPLVETVVVTPSSAPLDPEAFLAELLGEDVFGVMMADSVAFASAVQSMSAAVPEPSGAMLGVLTLLGFSGRRRR